MFKKIFKKDTALNEGDAETILNRLRNMPEEELITKQDELFSLARSHSSPTVRQVSTRFISDFARLSELLTHECVETSQSAALRIAQDTNLSAKVLEVPHLLEIPHMQHSMLQHAASIEQARLLNPPPQLIRAELVLGCVSDDVRQWLMSQIIEHAQLQELEKASRTRNKSVNRFAREQITKIKNSREQLDDRELEGEGIQQALATSFKSGMLSSALSDYRKIHLARAMLNNLRNSNLTLQSGNQSAMDSQLFAKSDLARLHLLQNKLAETEKKMAQAADDLDRQLTEQKAEQEAEQKRHDQLQKTLDAPDSVKPDMQIDNLTDKTLNVTEAQSTAQKLLNKTLKKMQDQQFKNEAALKNLDKSKPDPQKFNRLWLAQVASEKLSKNLLSLDKKQASTADSELLEQLVELEAKLQAFVEHSKGVREQLTIQLTRSLDKLEGLLADGNMKSATGLHADCRSKIRLLPTHSSRAMLSRFSGIDTKFNELKDWRSFAAQPKQQQLCEAAEKLADNALDPEAQAEELKNLRKKWQALGRANRELSLRFDAAASRAFAPCQVYFDEQNGIRTRNLEKRKAVLIQLQTYVNENDWDNSSAADWKATEKILRAARAEWNAYLPIDRNKIRSVQKKFDETCEKIHQKLNEEWKRNLDRKQHFVERVRFLANAESSLAEIISEAKTLQKSWREVGVTPRVQDQRLWREFRKNSDKIFARREEETKQHKESLVKENAALQADYDALSKNIDQFLTDLSEQGAVAPDIKPLFLLHRALTTKVSDTTSSMAGRVKKLGTRLKDLEKSVLAKQKASRLETLKALDMNLIEVENLIVAGSLTKSEELETNLLAIETQFQSLLPQGDYAKIAVACKKRVYDLFTYCADNDTSILEKHFSDALLDQTETVVRAELEAGLKSHESDEQLRMQMQVERLKSGLAKRQTETINPERLALAWCCTQSCGKQRQILSARHFAALTVLLPNAP